MLKTFPRVLFFISATCSPEACLGGLRMAPPPHEKFDSMDLRLSYPGMPRLYLLIPDYQLIKSCYPANSPVLL